MKAVILNKINGVFLSMIRSVIFDMDGLLVDTERLSMSCWRRALGRLGLPFSEDLILGCRGRSPKEMEPRFHSMYGDDLDFWTLYADKNKLMDEITAQEGEHLKVGAVTLLRWLKEQGYTISLATSTGEERASARLRRVGIFDYFDHLVYGTMVARYKPAPDIFLKAIELLGRNASECLVLEDSPNGIRAAHAAGAKPMMIYDLSRPDEELRSLLWAEGITLLDTIQLLEEDRAKNEL